MTKSNKTFSHKDVEAILQNLGHDVKCGACMAIAYTGTGLPGDRHTCEKYGTKSKKKSQDPRRAFIRGLAEYLAGDQAVRSIKLEMGDKDAQVWAKLRGLSPLFGYPTVDEAEKLLGSWLLGE